MLTDSPVLLVVMPFFHYSAPSLAMGLLKAQLARVGIRSSVAYWNLRFAELTGLGRYSTLSRADGARPGDWIFSHTLFGHSAEASNLFLHALSPLPSYDEERLADYEYARDMADPFLDECLEGKVCALRSRLANLSFMFGSVVFFDGAVGR